MLITVNDFDKAAALKIARDLHSLGFNLFATSGTAGLFQHAGLPVTVAPKVSEGGQTYRQNGGSGRTPVDYQHAVRTEGV